MNSQDAAMQDALRQDALPLIPVKLLGSLRGCCQALRHLVDRSTGPTWRSAAVSVLPLQTLPVQQDGYAVQSRLRLQAQLINKLLNGKRCSAYVMDMFQPHRSQPSSRAVHESEVKPTAAMH